MGIMGWDLLFFLLSLTFLALLALKKLTIVFLIIDFEVLVTQVNPESYYILRFKEAKLNLGVGKKKPTKTPPSL
jgi:hypothetical protein